MARRGKPLSDQWKSALSAGRKRSFKCKGPNLYNWKGGKVTESERMRMHRHKRTNQIQLQLDSTFIKALRIAQNNLCFYCEKPLKAYAAVEHLTPVSVGGDNQIFNLAWSCRSCNSKKRSKTLEEFAVHTGNIHWLDKWDYIYSTALVLMERYAGNRLPQNI